MAPLAENGASRIELVDITGAGNFITKTRKNENAKAEGKPANAIGSEVLFFVFSFFRVFVIRLFA
ncbi:MAG: hypothetical protein ACRELG_10185 [Gemmataceae bacterium]